MEENPFTDITEMLDILDDQLGEMFYGHTDRRGVTRSGTGITVHLKDGRKMHLTVSFT